MLKINGKVYKDSFCSRQAISHELTMLGEIDRLEDEVILEYFQVD